MVGDGTEISGSLGRRKVFFTCGQVQVSSRFRWSKLGHKDFALAMLPDPHKLACGLDFRKAELRISKTVRFAPRMVLPMD